MRTTIAILLLSALGTASAAAEESASVDHLVRRSSAALAPDLSTALHLAVGTTGPIAMQYATFDLAGSLALPTRLLPGRGWFIAPGLGLSLKSRRFAMEPLVDVEHKWVKPLKGLALVGYAGGGLGTNLGFNRGSTDWGFAFRGKGGFGVAFAQGFGLSTELALEVGPLVAPGGAFQGAVRWNLGGDIYF